MRSSLTMEALLLIMVATAHAGNLGRHFDITWGGGRGRMLNNGDILTLSLDKTSGSGFASKKRYLFGNIDMEIKLVPGDSAGTVTSYYLASGGAANDEIDYEFLGNVSGEPYTIHTNVYTRGKGDREQQFRAWFDPTKDFHTYSILWNPHHILFSVDGTPIRDFKNHEAQGMPFPSKQPMRLYSSIWNADDWATRGGLVKTDWSRAPFTATYRNFRAKACVWSDGTRTFRCHTGRRSGGSGVGWLNNQELDLGKRRRLKWVRENYMIYDYCKDRRRFPRPPPECSLSS